jgi:hypothetical protein
MDWSESKYEVLSDVIQPNRKKIRKIIGLKTVGQISSLITQSRKTRSVLSDWNYPKDTF